MIRPGEEHLGYAPERESWDEDFAKRDGASWAEDALSRGGHLADDVAAVLLEGCSRYPAGCGCSRRRA